MNLIEAKSGSALNNTLNTEIIIIIILKDMPSRHLQNTSMTGLKVRSVRSKPHNIT